MKYLLVGFFLFFSIESVKSHPVSISWINAKIEQKKISITYKILAEDLIYYYNPSHDENYDYEVELLKSLAYQYADFILNHLSININNGDFLNPKLININNFSSTSETINVMDMMKYEITYRIEYSFGSTQWDKLTFFKNSGNVKATVPSITFLSVFETNISLVENWELDYEQPLILVKGESPPSLKSSELTSSFFTVSSLGIRHELTIPKSTINTLLLQSQIKGTNISESVLSYLKLKNHIYNIDTKLIPQLSQIQSLTNNKTENGFVYIDIIYPTKGYPNNVLLTWSDYSWKFKWFNSEIITIDSSYTHTFSRFQPQLRIKTDNKIDFLKN